MRIKELREKSGMSQAQLAKQIGVDQSAVSLWETGKANPSIGKLIKISGLFGCTVDELLDTGGGLLSAAALDTGSGSEGGVE